MIEDYLRNQFYDQMLSEIVTGKNCIEVGFGTGILSFLALKYSPKHITAYEADPIRYQLGKHLIEKCGVQDQITLINKEFFASDIASDNDLIFHEILGVKLWDEEVQKIFNTQVPIFPNKFITEYYIAEVDLTLVSQIIQEKNNIQCKEWYKSIKDYTWPECYSFEDIKNLPDHILKECVDVFGFDKDHGINLVKYNPGIEIDTNFQQEIEHLLNAVVKNQIDGEIYSLSNFENTPIFSELDLTVDQTTKLATCTIDHNARTISYDYDYKESHTQPFDLNAPFVDLTIDLNRLKGRCWYILPKHGIAQGENKILLTNCRHWGHPNGNWLRSGIFMNNASKNLNIRQYLDCGRIAFSAY
jgi:hypothetical protein